MISWIPTTRQDGRTRLDATVGRYHLAVYESVTCVLWTVSKLASLNTVEPRTILVDNAPTIAEAERAARDAAIVDILEETQPLICALLGIEPEATP
jgi:hypothetical protein